MEYSAGQRHALALTSRHGVNDAVGLGDAELAEQATGCVFAVEGALVVAVRIFHPEATLQRRLSGLKSWRLRQIAYAQTITRGDIAAVSSNITGDNS